MPSFASCPNLTKTQYNYLQQDKLHTRFIQTPICRIRSTEVLLLVCGAATSTDRVYFRKLVASKNWIFETAVNSHHHDQKRKQYRNHPSCKTDGVQPARMVDGGRRKHIVRYSPVSGYVQKCASTV